MKVSDNTIIKSIEEQIIQYKNALNKIPELGWSEVETTKYIEKKLKQKPEIDLVKGKQVGGVYTIGSGENAILLRADIDALPTSKGIKHICGHSSHTAALLGAFLWLKKREQNLSRNNKKVIFIFQPAEETFPSGAKSILDENPTLLDKCTYAFAIHVASEFPIGTIALQKGMINAAGDYVEVKVIGKSVHVKDTLNGIDAIEGASYVISATKEFQKSFSSFGRDVVFNLNTIQGGKAANRIADEVYMSGDIRWQNKNDQQKIKKFFTNLPKHLSKLYKGEIIVTYFDGYPPLFNDPTLTDIISQKLKTKFAICTNNTETLGTEDFAFISQKTPSLYTKIGVGGKYHIHEDNFSVSDTGVVSIFHYWINLLSWWLSSNN